MREFHRLLEVNKDRIALMTAAFFGRSNAKGEPGDTAAVAAFFPKATAVATNEAQFTERAVNFPRESIEVKGNWIVISEQDKPCFHWNYNTSGQLLGLVAFRIISK